MKYFKKTIYLFLLTIISNYAQSNIIHNNGLYYFADRVVVKLKSESFNLNEILSNSKINKFRLTENINTLNKIANSNSNLERIHSLIFNSPFDPVYVSNEISKIKEIEWAEPSYLYEVTLTPNDSIYLAGTLQHLPVIKAEQAWDINTGSDEIIIAIVDTGVDWEHPDLQANIWQNPNETANNGIDDDGNGFIDDFVGWDFGGLDGTPDNNPKEDKADHGTLVAGLASAVTNNEIGVASIGYKTKIMAVKTAQNDIRSDLGNALIAYGYEGIKYAADNGAKVINCSWGGYNYSSFAKEIIDYAITKGALVVAAAGNDNSKDKFYPASYYGVVSVGGTNYVDQKASWSNYGTKLDVTAPGVNVTSTWQDSPFYHATSGTSLSSPIVAGLAGLAFNQFPGYNPLQIGEQIRVNSDNINNINQSFTNLLGSGRINAFKTLSNSNSKSVRITNIKFIEIGDGDEIFESGETVKIIPEFTNYLNPTANLKITLSIDNSNAAIIKSGGNIGALNTLEVKTINDLFEIEISDSAPENFDLNILVTYTDSDYNDFEWIELNINPTYQIQTTENLSLTFNSTGSIGFDDYPTNLKGKGLTYKDGPNLMFEGALIYGTSVSTINNVVRAADANKKDMDFRIVTPITLSIPGSFADKEIYAKFDDAVSASGLGVETELFTYSFAGEADADYMIVRYVFNNTTNKDIDNFYAGQYWDFDIDETSYDDDMIGYDNINNFGYIYDNDGNPVDTHIGLALLSSDKYGFFAMDAEGRNDSIISWDGFLDEEKWKALSNGLTFTSAGPSDISALISGGPFILEPNKKFEVDFLIAAGDNLSDLTNTVLRAKDKYSGLPTGLKEKNKNFNVNSFMLEQNYPNPFNPTTVIKYTIPSLETLHATSQLIQLKVYDVLGREVTTLVNKQQRPGSYKINFNAKNISSGVYYYQLKIAETSLNSNRSFIKTKKMILLR